MAETIRAWLDAIARLISAVAELYRFYKGGWIAALGRVLR
jgi:hypothetical protein